MKFREIKSVSRMSHVFEMAGLMMICPLLYFSCHQVKAQTHSEEPIAIPRLAKEIQLDGYIKEKEWQNAWQPPLTQYTPDFGAEPTEKTILLVGYTDKYLYAACKCYDKKEPSVRSFKRDYNYSDADWFSVFLDTYNDDQNGLFFGTTPTGLRTDFVIFNDGTITRNIFPQDINWNTFWNVKVRQNEKGWFAEMRIPFSSLRFKVEDGQTTMGFRIARKITRKSEVVQFPSTPPKWGFLSHLKASKLSTVTFKGLTPDPPFRVTPYLLGGLGQQQKFNQS